MTLRDQAIAKMQRNRRPVPSNTPYFFGLTAEENEALPCPLPLISECDVTVHEGGPVTFHRKVNLPRTLEVPAGLLIEQACRLQGVSVECADVVWV
jgi:hypothetical protein